MRFNNFVILYIDASGVYWRVKLKMIILKQWQKLSERLVSSKFEQQFKDFKTVVCVLLRNALEVLPGNRGDG